MERLYPYIARRLTPDWMRSFVVAEVDRVAAVADSDDCLTAHSRGWNHSRVYLHGLLCYLNFAGGSPR